MKHLALLLLFASSLFAQDLTHKAAKQAKPIVIRGATVHPVSGPAIKDGWVIFANGKLTHVGRMASIPMDWEIIEDLDVIEDLELFEAMVAMVERGRSS